MMLDFTRLKDYFQLNFKNKGQLFPLLKSFNTVASQKTQKKDVANERTKLGGGAQQ